ncbi:MAG: hypothetical protein O2854_02575 [Chloroflexi bacterium]|nr:hypothetical protein [Chloroflexota bacterium]
MSLGDVFFLIVRWLHLISAVVWIGGSIFFLLVMRPTARRHPDEVRTIGKTMSAQFRVLVDTSIVVLVATGAVIAFDRLTSGLIGPGYVITLGIKVTLSVWMFVLVQQERRRTVMLAAYTQPGSETKGLRRAIGTFVYGYNGITIAGVVIFLLSDLLRNLYEITLTGN